MGRNRMERGVLSVLILAGMLWVAALFGVGSGALSTDPPRESPFAMPHPVRDGRTLVVHVTPFNALMWDTQAPVAVVPHGVPEPNGVRYTGELERGVVVVNNNLHNLPLELGNDWPLRTPGNARPEQWYFDNAGAN